MKVKAGLFCFVAAAGLFCTAQAGNAQTIQDLKAKERETVVNVVGCVELESDYRKRIGEGKGGALGSGAGAANEFVLTLAKSLPTSATLTDKDFDAVGTSGFEEVYSLTGKLEDAFKREVGRQVEVTGYVEVDKSKGTLKVKDLPKFHVNQWNQTQDFCPQPKTSN